MDNGYEIVSIHIDDEDGNEIVMWEEQEGFDLYTILSFASMSTRNLLARLHRTKVVDKVWR